ncbi:MAG: VOC family protein [Betaproteobacteria bacterium]
MFKRVGREFGVWQDVAWFQHPLRSQPLAWPGNAFTPIHAFTPVCAVSREQNMAVVRYLVNDVDAALPFYEALGFRITERWGPPFAMLARDDLTLWLSGPGTSASRPLQNGAVPQPGGWNRLVIEVESIEETQRSLQSSGARFRSDPIEGPGGQQVLAEDPSGNPVELFEARRE